MAITSTSTSFLTKGSQVEVSSREAGSNDAWYSATVIKAPPSTNSPNHTSRNSLVYVEYHNLLSEDGSSNRLREYANIANVRPAPVSDTGPIDFQLNVVVDAFYKDGWWTGVITTVVDASNFAVTFQNRPDEVQFRCEDLRIHKEWIGGRWYQLQKQDDMALRTTDNQTKKANPITAKESLIATSIMKSKRQDLDNNEKASPNEEITNVNSSKKKKPTCVELEVNGTTETFSHEKKVMASEPEKKTGRMGRISDFRHNMVAFIDETDKKMATYLDVAAFLRRSRIFYAITVECDAYQSIIDEFWNNAKKVEAEIHSTVQGKPIIISEEIIRKVLQFGDSKNDPVLLDEKLCKGCFLRMGYKGDINARVLSKAGLSPPFKYLVHMVVHCLSHRKGGYDDLLDYTLCATTALCLNLPFNFSKMVFENMLLNLNEGRWWMYPRFIQLIINHQHPDLKKEGEKVKHERMNSNSCSGLKCYRGTSSPPKFRKLFGHLLKEDYVAPTDNKWRKDDSDSDGERAREDAIMVKYVLTHVARRRYLKIESQEEKSKKKRKRKPIVEVETSESEKDADVSSQDSESEMANVEYDRNKSRFVLKKREKVQVDPDNIDETYNPEQETSKKAEASKKSKGRTKTMSKRSKTPALIDVPSSDNEPVQNVEVSDATQKSQKDDQEQVDPSQIFGTLPESLSGFDNLFVERKEFDDLKAVVDDQTVTIESLAAENDRLRSENVEKQRRFEESENKRIAQTKLLDQHIKYFTVLEKRFDLDLAKESDKLDMAEQDKGENVTNEAPIDISNVKTTFRDQKLTCSKQEPRKLRQKKTPPKIFNLRKRR